MEPIWLQSYPEGIPAEISIDPYRSLADLVAQSVANNPDRTAFICMGKGLTYRKIDHLSNAFAAYLQKTCRLAPGARVAIMMPNILQYPIAMFGALKAGYAVVNCNPLYTPRELEFQLKDSGAQAIVVVENFAHVLAEVVHNTDVRHVFVTKLGDMLSGLKGVLVNAVVKYVKKMVPAWKIDGAVRFGDALKAGAGQRFDPVEISPDDLAFLQYTGGTTGVPKGAMLTHGNILANAQQAHAWLKPFLGEAPPLIVTPLPLYHIFALTANCMIFFKVGATNLLITNPRDIPGFVKELAKYPFTCITGVNTLFNALLNNPKFAKIDFSHLNITLGGGMAVQRAVAERWKEVTGKPLIEAYGLTETSPAATVNPLNLENYNGSIGLPLPSTEVALRDEGGQDVAPGEAGELCIRGPQVMKGYWRRPEETANVIMPDGFLRTGDIAEIDDKGFVRIVDRKKDMILVSGFNVYPNEVEDVIAQHPGVLEVGVIGVPDDRSGEAVKAVVVKKNGSLSEQDIVAFCRDNLTAYKVPHIIEFRDELPKTPVGKILRRALREGTPA